MAIGRPPHAGGLQPRKRGTGGSPRAAAAQPAQLGDPFAGLIEPSRLRGRSLSSSATRSSSAWVIVPKSVPLGKYWRSSPLVFSLVPRCHGEWGSQKIHFDSGVDPDLLPVAHLGSLVPGQRATQAVGQGLDLGRQRGGDLFGFVAVGQRDQQRVAGLRSTSVAIAVLLFLPISRSPSQCPGTARSSASWGRWAMLVMSGARLRATARGPGLRSDRPVRKHLVSSRRRAPLEVTYND